MRVSFRIGLCLEQGQRHGQHILDAACVVDRDALGQLRGQILFDILTVLRRQDDGLNPGSARSQEFLFDAAHRQHIAAEGDLAGHRGQR